MNYGKSGTSIVEALVVMLMVITGVVGLFSIFSEAQKLSNSTEQRIQAIQIAREGIEAVENIRDTNWLLFSADYGNCWNVLEYNNSCFGNTTSTYDTAHSGSYIVVRDTYDRWILTGATLDEVRDFSDTDYRVDYRVRKDTQGFYTQSGGTDFNPIFTRELRIHYLEDTNTSGTIDSNDEKLRVTSIVQWNDSAGDTNKKIELQTELTNWKNEN